jgi:hypothetical protein
VLRYRRAERVRAICEYLFADPLGGLRLAGVPSVVVYGRGDSVLRLDDAAAEAEYRAAFERLLPDAAFHPVECVDHHWTGASALGNSLLVDFCESVRPLETVELTPAPKLAAAAALAS